MRPLLPLALALVLAPLGCAHSGKGPDATRESPAPLPAGAYPFVPVALRVHPLTHVDSGELLPGGARLDRAEIVLHFELLDRFGDGVKGLGTVKVELYKPGQGMSPGIETQELTWDIPGMDDPQENTAHFDQATRTYRVQLVAPRWVADAVAPPTPAGGPGWVKLRVVMTEQGADGAPIYLEDEYVIQG